MCVCVYSDVCLGMSMWICVSVFAPCNRCDFSYIYSSSDMCKKKGVNSHI